MSPAAFAWLTVAAVLVYIASADANVYDWLVLQSRRLGIEIKRLWYLVRYNPDSPWVRFEIKRNADRMAKEILKEFKNR